MKKTILYAAAILVSSSFALQSCSDFLEQQNPSVVSSDNYWNNKEEAEAMLAGCYNVLQQQGLYYNYYNSADPRALDGFGTTDGASGWWFWSPAEMALTWGEMSPSCNLVTIVWDLCYKGIARCNEVIKYVPEMGADKISKDDANRIVAEAKFLRAFYYNYLTSLYRDVPLCIEPTKDGYMPVSKKGDVMDWIANDLEQVLNAGALPKTVSPDERGRATLGAGWGLLCRIYLYNEKWDKALSASQKVMELGYSLEPDYLTLFSEAGCTSNEIVFSVRFSATADGADNKMRGFLSTRNNDEYFTPIVVTQKILDEYYDKDGNPIADSPYDSSQLIDPAYRDPRWGYNFCGIKEDWTSEDWVNWTQVLTGHINKYQDYTVTEKFYDDQDYYVIRYADILLMRAEALVKTGKDSDAMKLIDQVRDRASVRMPHVTQKEIDLLGGAMNLIKHERRVELAFEGFRYVDLRRWGDYDQLTETKAVGVDRARVWPIPQKEIDNNKAIVQASEWSGE